MKSIAVLPFESLSESKSDTYFADGVQDEILNNLAKIAQLKVVSRTSVMQYRADAKRDLRQIAGTARLRTQPVPPYAAALAICAELDPVSLYSLPFHALDAS